jgi:hypothetical protein
VPSRCRQAGSERENFVEIIKRVTVQIALMIGGLVVSFLFVLTSRGAGVPNSYRSPKVSTNSGRNAGRDNE